MRMRFLTVLVLVLSISACGGDEDSAQSGDADNATGIVSAPAEADGTAPEAEPAGDDASAGGDGPVLTEVPDPCDYFTRADAEAVLGEATGPGRSYDAGGWNCVYDTQGDERLRLVFDMYVGRGDSVEDTQIGMSIEACAAEVVERYGDLGRASALYRNTAAHCNDGHFLWVLSPARFEGRLRPEFERDTKGPVHFLVSISPGGDRAAVAPRLRDGARRALARLQQ